MLLPLFKCQVNWVRHLLTCDLVAFNSGSTKVRSTQISRSGWLREYDPLELLPSMAIFHAIVFSVSNVLSTVVQLVTLSCRLMVKSHGSRFTQLRQEHTELIWAACARPPPSRRDDPR